MDWNQLQESLTVKRPPGSNAHKLTWKQVTAIREAYAAGGTTLQKLADKYGVNRVTIYRIVRYVYWS